MNRKLIIGIIAGVILAVIIGVVIGSQHKNEDHVSTGVIGSKDSSVTATPTPATTGGATAGTPTPDPSPTLPGECYQDGAPDYCAAATQIDPSTVLTPDQIATESVVIAFAAQFSRYDGAEAAPARSSRLQPLVADPAVAAKPTALSRPSTRLSGLTGTAEPTVDYATYLSTDKAGNWVYEADGSYVGRYIQQGTGTTTTFAGAVTWTVTVTPDPSHKVVSVSEAVPTLNGAP